MDYAAMSIAYIAKVVSNACKFAEPLNVFEQMLVSQALSEALDALESTSSGELLTRRQIQKMPALLRLIGRDSSDFMHLYRKCIEAEIDIADSQLGDPNCVNACFDADPVNVLAELTREMCRVLETKIGVLEEQSSNAFAYQRNVLSQLADRGHLAHV